MGGRKKRKIKRKGNTIKILKYKKVEDPIIGTIENIVSVKVKVKNKTYTCEGFWNGYTFILGDCKPRMPKTIRRKVEAYIEKKYK